MYRGFSLCPIGGLGYELNPLTTNLPIIVLRLLKFGTAKNIVMASRDCDEVLSTTVSFFHRFCNGYAGTAVAVVRRDPGEQCFHSPETRVSPSRTSARPPSFSRYGVAGQQRRAGSVSHCCCCPRRASFVRVIFAAWRGGGWPRYMRKRSHLKVSLLVRQDVLSFLFVPLS